MLSGLVGSSMLERYAHLLDVRTRTDTRCLCFTKNYTRSATGAGSVLATAAVPPSAGDNDAEDAGGDDGQERTRMARPRWFSVAEVARLHGFGFEARHIDAGADAQGDAEAGTAADAAAATTMPVLGWPAGVSTKEKYQLLGNSMHVGVVQALVMHLLGVKQQL